jgi:hypothetical protein
MGAEIVADVDTVMGLQGSLYPRQRRSEDNCYQRKNSFEILHVLFGRAPKHSTTRMKQ